jgi:pre-mRNA-splicing factor SYF1
MWKEFEIKHGNEDTVREMLRVKRSVQATYNTNVNYMSAQMLASIGGQAEVAGELSAADSMALLEARAQKIAQAEAAAGKPPRLAQTEGRAITFVRGESKTTQEAVTENPEEIDIGEDEDEEMEEAGGSGLYITFNIKLILDAPETLPVPDAVFASLGKE